MESVLNSNIFFFITSIFVVIISLVSLIAGYYVIRIFKNFAQMTDTLKDSVNDAHEHIAEIGAKLSAIPFLNFLFTSKKHKRHEKK